MSPEAKGHLIGVLFVAAIAAIGIYILLIGFGQFGRRTGDAPSWVMIAAGAAFLLAAGSMGLSAIAGLAFGAKAWPDGNLLDDAPYAIRAAQTVLSLGIVAMLATVATWVAFNPAAGSSTGSRIAFAVGAAMTWTIFLGFVIWRLRRLRR
jgi:hypothetical protein